MEGKQKKGIGRLNLFSQDDFPGQSLVSYGDEQPSPSEAYRPQAQKSTGGSHREMSPQKLDIAGAASEMKDDEDEIRRIGTSGKRA